MKKLLFLSFLSLMTFGCNDDDNSGLDLDTMFTVYELFYQTNKDQTTARVTFRQGTEDGPTLIIPSPAEVSFNGNRLLYNQSTGAYENLISGFIPSGTFIFEDWEKNTYTNSTPEISPISFTTIDTIATNSDFILPFEGIPIRSGDNIVLTIVDPTSSNTEVFTSTTINATEIQLESERLLNISTGNATTTLFRFQNNSSLNEAFGRGGRMGIWYQDKKTIFIKN